MGVSIKKTIGAITKSPNKIIQFAISGIVGAIVVVIGVGLLGELFGGLLARAVLAGMGQPQIGAVIAFDEILSLFRPQPSGGI